MAEQNYGARTIRNAVTRDQVDSVLEYLRQKDIERQLALRAVGSQDLGLKVSEKYDWKLLERLGITPFMLQSVFDSLDQVGHHAQDIYNKSIAALANNTSPARRMIPAQALNLDEKIERHLYN